VSGDARSFDASSSDAEFPPTDVGVNVTVMRQVELGARVWPEHPSDVTANIAASVPVSETAPAPMMRLPVPDDVTVTVRAGDVEPGSWLPNASGLGLATAAGLVVPVPVRPTVVGDEMPFEAMLADAVFGPADVGVNVIPTAHELLGARVWPEQVSDATVNIDESVPVMVTALPESTKLRVPEDVTVIVDVVDDPTAHVPKATDVGDAGPGMYNSNLDSRKEMQWNPKRTLP
jgi:hypothetical protein